MTAAKKATQKVGTDWVIEAAGSVEISRPDGEVFRVEAFDGVAIYVLTQPGEHTATADFGSTTITAK